MFRRISTLSKMGSFSNSLQQSDMGSGYAGGSGQGGFYGGFGFGGFGQGQAGYEENLHLRGRGPSGVLQSRHTVSQARVCDGAIVIPPCIPLLLPHAVQDGFYYY